VQLLDVLPEGSASLGRSTPEIASADAGEGCSTYLFNKHVIKHCFCADCGIHPFGEGADPKGNQMAAVNARCLEGIELSSFTVKNFNGRAL
jgi:hypothetical protein